MKNCITCKYQPKWKNERVYGELGFERKYFNEDGLVGVCRFNLPFWLHKPKLVQIKEGLYLMYEYTVPSATDTGYPSCEGKTRYVKFTKCDAFISTRVDKRLHSEKDKPLPRYEA